MKKLSLMYLFTMLITISINVSAARYSAEGKINQLQTTSDTLNGSATAESILFVEGFTSAGTCLISGLAYVRIIVKSDTIGVGDRMFSTLLAAQLAGKKVSVLVDDSHNNGFANGSKTNDNTGSCYLQLVRIVD